MPFTPLLLRTMVAASALCALSAMALDKPEGRVVLTISGSVSQANNGSNAVFDMKMLEKMPQKTFSTQTARCCAMCWPPLAPRGTKLPPWR
jgi:hypothetical protein